MRNVAGLSTSEAQKSSDMLLKCRYIDEITVATPALQFLAGRKNLSPLSQ